MKVRAAEIGTLDGEWHESTLGPAVEHVSRRTRGTRGDLYVFVAVNGPDGPALEAEVAGLVATAYYDEQSRGGLTSGLTRALVDANAQLFAANQDVAEEDRRAAAVACALLRDSHLYIARTSNALAYLVVPEGVRLLAQIDRGETGLGSGLGVYPILDPDLDLDLFHHDIDEQCGVVLAAEPFDQIISPGEVRQVLVSADSLDAYQALRALLVARASEHDLRAAVIDITEAPPLVAAEPPARTAAPGQTADEPPSSPEDSEVPDVRHAETAESFSEHDSTVALADESGGTSVGTDLSAGPSKLIGDHVVDLNDRLWASIRAATATRSRLGKLAFYAALVALALFAAVAIPLRLWQDRQEGIADYNLVTLAEQKERDAQQAATSAERLRLLVEANDVASRAARLRRADPTAQAASERLQGELDSLSGVVRLAAPSRLLALDGQPARMVLGGGDLYVVDRSANRVYRYPLAPSGLAVQPLTSPVILRRGDRFGEQSAAQPTKLLWLPAGSGRQTDTLVIADDAGALFEFEPTQGTRALRFPAPVRSDQYLAGYAGGLYLLDPAAPSLTYLPPSADGFDRAAYPYFSPETPVRLEGASGLAAGSDLFILQRGGRIERYSAGRSVKFDGTIPDQPLGIGASLTATARSLYVLDPANQRLVQLDHAGAFQRQYRFPARDDVLDVGIDEARGLLYYLGKQGIYLDSLGDVNAPA